MTNHELPFFKQVKSFKRHMLDLTITQDAARQNPKHSKLVKFLLLSDDIPKFARLLRILDLANFMGFHFSFAFRQATSSELQPAHTKQILLPFKQVTGVAIIQEVTITGPVDPSLAARVKRAMTQKVAWVRGGAWEIHDLTVSIKRVGDSAFVHGNADMTMAKYLDSRTFQETALGKNTMMGGCDQEWLHALFRLDAITWTDLALLMISDVTKQEEGERHYKQVLDLVTRMEDCENANTEAKNEIVPTSVIARFYCLLGVAELGLLHPNKAGKAFAKAYKILSHKHYKQGWELAKAWPTLSKKGRQDRFDDVLANLPSAPLASPDTKEYSTVEVASEHWVMRKLGHEGFIPYANKIKPATSIALATMAHPNHSAPVPRTVQVGKVKPEVLQKHVARYMLQMNSPQAQGKLICWVHLDRRQIIGESGTGGIGVHIGGGSICFSMK